MQTRKSTAAPHARAPVDEFFANEVWAKVGSQSCLECHKSGGDAEDSEFILLDPRKSGGGDQDAALRHNREQFVQMARLKKGDESRLLLKVTGKIKHGGKDVLKPDSAGYRVLADFVRRLYAPPADAVANALADEKNAKPFFDGVVMLDDRRLLRRVTLSLAGRLPTDAELARSPARGSRRCPRFSMRS